MHTRRLLLSLLVPVLIAGCRRGDGVSQTEGGQLVVGDVEEREVVERGIDPGRRTLVLDGFNGTITLEGTPEAVARLAFEKTARGDDASDARARLAHIRIDESGGDAEYRYVMQSDDPDRTAVNVRGTVPAGTTVRLALRNGTVSLSALTGSIRVYTTNGNVHVAGAAADVEVEVQNGSIDVGLQALPPEAALRLTTQNGNVALTLPGDAGARLTARTQAGAIRSEGLAFTDQSLQPQGAGADFSARLGRGTASVELATQNGNIALNEGRVVTLPAAQPASPAPAPPAGAPTTPSPPSAQPDTTAASR